MLGVLTPDALRRAVATEDLVALTTVPGIGKKGAQRIVLELAGRLGAVGDAETGGLVGVAAVPGQAAWREQVRAGLVNLGWQARDADAAIAAIEPELTPVSSGPADGDAATAGQPAEVDVAVALRAALRVLSRP
jgi:Holliday junction DNA helicase RuvA